MFERVVARWRRYRLAEADRLWPERAVHVRLTDAGLEVLCPGEGAQYMAWSDVSRILVKTNDSGPWGSDVWWVLEGGAVTCGFPQGATGESAALDEIERRFSGFEVKGMNSVENATFVCWEAKHAF